MRNLSDRTMAVFWHLFVIMSILMPRCNGRTVSIDLKEDLLKNICVWGRFFQKCRSDTCHIVRNILDCGSQYNCNFGSSNIELNIKDVRAGESTVFVFPKRDEEFVIIRSPISPKSDSFIYNINSTARNAEMSIAQVSTMHSGIYLFFTANFRAGTCTKNGAFLRVLVRPSIMEKPASNRNQMTLQCVSNDTSYPGLNLSFATSWQSNEIDIARNPRIFTENDQLTINPMECGDLYSNIRCMVIEKTTAVSSEESEDFIISQENPIVSKIWYKVKGLPNKTLEDSITAEEGNQANIGMEFYGNRLCDDVILLDHRYQEPVGEMSSPGKFQVQPLQCNHTGVYLVVAFNSTKRDLIGDSVKLKTFRINVLCEPRLLENYNNQTIVVKGDVGQSTALSFTTIANPRPQAVTFPDILNTTITSINEYTYRIHGVLSFQDVSDFRTYEINITNDRNITLRVYVHTIPRGVKRLDVEENYVISETGKVGTNITLTVNVVSSQKPMVAWHPNTVTQTSHFTFTVEGMVSIQNVFDFRDYVMNITDDVDDTLSVKFQVTPKGVTGLDVDDNSVIEITGEIGETIVLSVDVIANQTPKFVWFPAVENTSITTTSEYIYRVYGVLAIYNITDFQDYEVNIIDELDDTLAVIFRIRPLDTTYIGTDILLHYYTAGISAGVAVLGILIVVTALCFRTRKGRATKTEDDTVQNGCDELGDHLYDEITDPLAEQENRNIYNTIEDLVPHQNGIKNQLNEDIDGYDDVASPLKQKEYKKNYLDMSGQHIKAPSNKVSTEQLTKQGQLLQFNGPNDKLQELPLAGSITKSPHGKGMSQIKLQDYFDMSSSHKKQPKDSDNNCGEGRSVDRN